MKIIAYSYSEPLLELPPDRSIWGEVERVYEDLGERTQLQQLLRDCRTNPPEYLLIRQLEELGDSVKEIRERLKEIESLGIQIIFLYNQQLNTSEPQRAELLKLLEEIQQNQRSRCIRKGHARNRLKNLPPPGKAPYGYRRGKERYTIDRVQAPIVKDFFEHFLLYGSLRGAIRYLEKKHGKKISVSTARQWLTNPVYRGDLKYQNGEIISNTHTPIISREEAAQVERILRRNRRLPTRSASAPRSLAGLVICSECNSLLTVSRVTAYRKKGEYLYLRPSNCPKQPKCKAIPYEQVLQRTIEAICRDLPPAVAGLNLPDIDVVKNEIIRAIATKKEILSQLPSLQTTGILDAETADLRAYKLRTEISQLQSRLTEMPPVNLRETCQTVSLPQFWLDLSESERRFYFREFLSKIEIIRQNETWQLRLIFIF
ncbi:MAG: recombinase family protein [Oscillatoriaceae bacterium SKW80]|nr:recombinase family protein [Oscillatoriaceae bacterium SKYG93]MCX8119499.1 recombinase family protein [Oscillatoriaceae bacterium SKW80]MDW8454966.1 recombinase family protein [Oscillatoriaceae cyanobacterium SKYGB_i_bin93]HIK28255.1 recombinase family protein [Oscillatoriaceae cyanobacterium M7585_C2015_266]